MGRLFCYIYVMYLVEKTDMEKKKSIKVFKSFRELDEDQLKQNLAMSLEQRWEAFWRMQRNHKQLFHNEANKEVKSLTTKKRIIFSKPEWI